MVTGLVLGTVLGTETPADCPALFKELSEGNGAEEGFSGARGALGGRWLDSLEPAAEKVLAIR